MSSVRRFSVSAFALSALLAFATVQPASAQQSQSPAEILGATSTSAIQFAPLAAPFAPALPSFAAETPADAPTAELAVVRAVPSVNLMIIGGAAMIVGSAVGNETGRIMIAGGAVTALIGLFHYLS